MTQILVSQSEPSWQEEMINAVQQPQELLRLLELPPELLPGAVCGASDFALKVPRPFVGLMRKGDPDDPLLRQVLPLDAELRMQQGYIKDPLAERDHNLQPGIVHKYHGRVLLVVAPNCAVNCRYCFRRHFPYGDNTPGRQQWAAVFEYLERHPDISEVIFSGGDPLACPDRQLHWMAQRIADIRHIRRLRVHARMPVVIPQRITSECLSWLSGTRLKTSVVLHVNHPRELGEGLVRAIARLRNAGITVLNQAVLLRGVNDSFDCLRQLCEDLFEHGVLPYYLHMLDPVQGAAHFAVDEDVARDLYRQLHARLPGYLLPRLARDKPGAVGKTLLT